MSEKTFFEICGEFFDKMNPNVYDDIEPNVNNSSSYYYSDFTSYIIKMLIFILSDNSNTELNTLKYEVY